MTKSKLQSGFSIVETILVLLIVSMVSFTGWYVYHVQKNVNQEYKSQHAATDSSAQIAHTNEQDVKNKNLKGWREFSNATLGLTFHYPGDWGESMVETVGGTDTRYKISFSKSTSYITVANVGSVQESDITFANLKADIRSDENAKKVFANDEKVVGEIVPSFGNQDAEIYAARSITLSNVNANDMVLFDTKKYDNSCKHESYKTSCYKIEELNTYLWLLEDASVINT